MFRLLVLLFIFVPIVEITLFIQVGDKIGLGLTLLIVILTAVIGVNLLKQQGFQSWQKIQNTMAQGQVPALEMAAAAQLLFAGGLLLTPGFLTDLLGFLLMVPQIRDWLAIRFISTSTSSVFHSPSSFNTQHADEPDRSNPSRPSFNSGKMEGRTIEGEFEEKR